jgi:hypothetical protein
MARPGAPSEGVPTEARMRRLCSILVVVVTACGGSRSGGATPAEGGTADDGSGGDASDDGGMQEGGDASGDGGFVVAAHPPPPQVTPSGGPVIANPKIVPVSFPMDPLAGDIDVFSAAFASTTYWGDVVAEYGIAPAKPLAPIHVTTPVGATIDDSAIKTWLASQLDGTHPEWPAPDKDTVYVLYYPPGTTVTSYGMTSCVGFHGYHSDAQVGSKYVTYAVVSRCASIPEANVTGIQYVSAVASHEVVEALTDPLPDVNPAYSGPDNDHLAWALALGGELGDMCALQGEVFFMPPDFPYTVQRIWSNAAAKAGKDPCVPAYSGVNPFVEAVPVTTDKVLYDYYGSIGATKGVHVPLGQTKTIELDLISSAPTPGPFTVSVGEGGTTTPNVTLTLDKNKGSNGDKLQLTIAPHATNQVYGGELVLIRATLGTRKTYDYLFVSN